MMVTKKAVAVVIHNKIGKILLSQRGPYKEDEFGKWENCGGAVENGETEEESIKREVLEELGCKLQITNTIYKDIFTTAGGVKWEVTVFEGKTDDEPKIQNPNENTNVKWFDKEDLKNVDLASYTYKDFKRFGWI